MTRLAVIGLAVALAAFAALLAVGLLTDFATVPCQDGVWDAARQRCIPPETPRGLRCQVSAPPFASSSPAPSITARATVIEKPARAMAARSFWRLAARSPRDHGPSRLRRAAFRAAVNSSSSPTLLARAASSRPTPFAVSVAATARAERPRRLSVAALASAKRWSSTSPEPMQRETTSSSAAACVAGSSP